MKLCDGAFRTARFQPTGAVVHSPPCLSKSAFYEQSRVGKAILAPAFCRAVAAVYELGQPIAFAFRLSPAQPRYDFLICAPSNVWDENDRTGTPPNHGRWSATK